MVRKANFAQRIHKNIISQNFSRLCCRWCRVRRRVSEYESNPQNPSSNPQDPGSNPQDPNSNPSNPNPIRRNPNARVRQDQVGKEKYMPTDIV